MDPKHLLEGEGKRMRHVKIRTLKAADALAVRQLLKQAYKNARAQQKQGKLS